MSVWYVPAWRAGNGNVIPCGAETLVLEHAQRETYWLQQNYQATPGSPDVFVAFRDVPDWEAYSDDRRAITVLTVETQTIPVFVDEDPPRLIWRGFEQVPARRAEFIPHSRSTTVWHSRECPDCVVEPGVHDRRHAEILDELRPT